MYFISILGCYCHPDGVLGKQRPLRHQNGNKGL